MSGNNITFCINCGEKTEYIVKSQRVDMSVRGIEFSYVEHTVVFAAKKYTSPKLMI